MSAAPAAAAVIRRPDHLASARLLVIDTVDAACAVAVMAGEAVLTERRLPMARGHAEALFPLIDGALRAAATPALTLYAVAVCTGPGGFAGVRVGVAAARGLALGLGRPAVGVDWFSALAAGTRGERRVTLPAPRGRVYRQLFRDGVAQSSVETVDPDPDAAADDAPAYWLAVRDGAGLALLGREALAALSAAPAPPRPAPLYLRPPDAIAPAPGLAARQL